jgi:hypothetical protein
MSLENIFKYESNKKNVWHASQILLLLRNVIGVVVCLSIVDPKYDDTNNPDGGSSTGENLAKFGGF